MKLEQDWIWTLPALTSWFWATGGSGFLPARRYGVPLAVSLYALHAGASFIAIMLYFASSLPVITFGPGYGDKFEKYLGVFYWPYLVLLGGLYGASNAGLLLHSMDWGSLVCGSILTSLVFVGSMRASKSWKWITWKWCEMATGFCVGLTATLIMR